MTDIAAHPLFAAPEVDAVRRPDDTWLVSSRVPLGEHVASVGVWLQRWAAEVPDRILLAERATADEEWHTVTYADTWEAARELAGALLVAGLGPDRPLAVLSGPSVAHGQLMLAAHLAGVPLVPVSVAYSLIADDPAKLLHIVGQTRPGLVFVEATEPFRRALGHLDRSGVVGDQAIVSGDGGVGRSLSELRATGAPAVADGRVDAAYAAVGPDHLAKILYTSGSTGLPKGVLTTHRMLCSNQQAISQVWPFLTDSPPVVCDWLPWSHTFGSSHNFNLVLANGGSLYVDAGKPMPGLFDLTAANLADVRPTICFNVPAGYARLVERLEADAELAAAFFERLELIFYAAAALPDDLWRRLEAASRVATGRVVPMTSSWGLTETAPAATSAHFALDRAGVIGTPLPGTTIKLVPSFDKTEVRVAGPGVTRGYFAEPERTVEAFDDEGFFVTGDAARFADPERPEAGLVFDGRVAEDFKLSTGTRVSVGMLRPALVAAAAPLMLDAVVTGHDRDYIGLLVWPTPAHASDPDLADGLRAALAAHNAANHNTSSTEVRRVIVLATPPSIDSGETTDKGYINQRAALAARADDVARLYADPPGPGVIVVS